MSDYHYQESSGGKQGTQKGKEEKYHPLEIYKFRISFLLALD